MINSKDQKKTTIVSDQPKSCRVPTYLDILSILVSR